MDCAKKKNTISLDTLGNDTKDLVCIAAKRTLLAPPCQCNVMSEVSFRTATPVSMAEDTPTPPRCTCLKIFSWTWSMVIPTLRSCQPAYMGSPPPTRWSSQKSKYKYRDHLVGDCQKYPWADRSILWKWGRPMNTDFLRLPLQAQAQRWHTRDANCTKHNAMMRAAVRRGWQPRFLNGGKTHLQPHFFKTLFATSAACAVMTPNLSYFSCGNRHQLSLGSLVRTDGKRYIFQKPALNREVPLKLMHSLFGNCLNSDCTPPPLPPQTQIPKGGGGPNNPLNKISSPLMFPTRWWMNMMPSFCENYPAALREPVELVEN